MLHSMKHTSVDVHTDDDGEQGSLLSNPHHHHHVHLPKFSLSPPDTKVNIYNLGLRRIRPTYLTNEKKCIKILNIMLQFRVWIARTH